ncbi:MAG: cytochrome c [Deltaproteobacteria bacterium]|nr:MAG: cytochrome c [Deltaproteobacteria bacterium]
MKRLIILSLILGVTHQAFAFEAPAYFEKSCGSCHTVGRGDDVGPDLKGVTERRTREWLHQFIQSSQSVIQSGDPVANELFAKFKNKKMPDQDLAVEEIDAILDLIKNGGISQTAGDSRSATTSTPEDVTKGEDFFLGRISFKNGGAPCVSCHSVSEYGPLGGGVLGPNLTQAYSKYEDKGLGRAIKKPAFRVMKEIYSGKELTDDEVFAVKSFLYKADQQGSQNIDFEKKFIFLGGVGVVVM